ncbi:MAG: prepilin-type N-terminal cleavage/methylation domain-containing protein [Planctomycetota bacterium]
MTIVIVRFRARTFYFKGVLYLRSFMVRRNKGFTLIELMIVVAIIAIVASIAIPNLLSARLNANESAAIATLRNVVAAQAQIQAQGAIDVDQDGIGEYGYFAEMAGSVNLRAAAAAPAVSLTPPVLSGALGLVDANGFVNKAGYYFLMYIADGTASGGQGEPEAANGGDGGAALATWAGQANGQDNAENFWACYAWPVSQGNSGNRAFMANQSGDLLQTSNQVVNYTSTTSVPAALAAYVNTAVGMDAKLSIGSLPAAATDTGVWTVCN